MTNPNESETLTGLDDALQDLIGKVEHTLEQAKESVLETFTDCIGKVEDKADSAADNTREAIALIKAAYFKLDNLHLDSYFFDGNTAGNIGLLRSHIDDVLSDLETATDYLIE